MPFPPLLIPLIAAAGWGVKKGADAVKKIKKQKTFTSERRGSLTMPWKVLWRLKKHAPAH